MLFMKNVNPLVTIAIPFYNAEKFLNLAIQSVCNQTYDNWELLKKRSTPYRVSLS